MTFYSFVLQLEMALSHVFTKKFIEEQDALAQGTVLEESYDAFVERHLYAFITLRGATEQQVKDIEAAILRVKENAKLHVIMFNAPTLEGTGYMIDQIDFITQFWDVHFAS